MSAGYSVEFIDLDAVRISWEDHELTCYRTNIDGTWHPIWLQQRVPSFFQLEPAMLEAIRTAEELAE